MRTKKYFLPLLLSALVLTALVTICPPLSRQAFLLKAQVLDTVDRMTLSCLVDSGITPVYSGQLQSIVMPGQVEPNQLFQGNITVKNTGTVPWFSDLSGCGTQPPVYLGTARSRDRESAFFAPLVFGQTQWLGGSRIKMKSLRVEPGEIAEFEFLAHAPAEPGIYREYLAPVVEGVTWMDKSAEFSFDINVGQPDINSDIYRYSKDLPMSLNLLDPKLAGGKKIRVDLSEQKMYLQLGETIIKTFPVSSGKRATPTPRGSYKIQFKQDVRVAGTYPHYIMPKFMQFRKGGYGIHALPSLANDRGVFWREAWNHIGSPRSHGCIRLLPDDADFTYQFADVGTPLDIVW